MLDNEAAPFIDSNYAVGFMQQAAVSRLRHSDRLNVVHSCFLLVPICSAGDCRAFSFTDPGTTTIPRFRRSFRNLRYLQPARGSAIIAKFNATFAEE
jgi:hypothetical protein